MVMLLVRHDVLSGYFFFGDLLAGCFAGMGDRLSLLHVHRNGSLVSPMNVLSLDGPILLGRTRCM